MMRTIAILVSCSLLEKGIIIHTPYMHFEFVLHTKDFYYVFFFLRSKLCTFSPLFVTKTPPCTASALLQAPILQC